jgi:phospholipid/cholesterol/gamma-HCH transport system permease protein
MIKFFQKIGKKVLNDFYKIGESGVFLYKALSAMPNFPLCIRRLIHQIYYIGVLSLPIILFSGLFIGMVMGFQGLTLLKKFNASQALGQLVALSVIRELGPVITALLFTGRAGATLTAEISLMKATEQLSSMEIIGVNPLHRIISPRFLAGTISLPLLSLIFMATAIYGSYIVGVVLFDVDNGAFWGNMQSAVDFKKDILNSMLKSFIFGILISWISTYQGFFSQQTSDGINIATTKTVIHSTIIVLFLDLLLTTVMFGDDL